jgi:hypothetical protein
LGIKDVNRTSPEVDGRCRRKYELDRGLLASRSAVGTLGSCKLRGWE